MSKYINLEKQLVRLYRLNLSNEEVIRLFLLTACTEDAQEVRHGRWIDNTPSVDEYGNPLFMVSEFSKYIDLSCSVCGRKATIKTDYCPNCGSRMDLDEVEE